MAFKPSDAVEPLEYDFRDSGVDWIGIVPEPSQDDVEALFAAWRKIGAQGSVDSLAALQEGENPGAVLSSLSDDTLSAVIGSLVSAVADFCKGSPDADTINALPFRHRQVFLEHLLGEIANPTRRTPVSRASVVRSNGAALAG